MRYDLKVQFNTVTDSIQKLYGRAHSRYVACNCQDDFELTKWLTGEEVLVYKRLASRQDALLAAIEEYSGLTFSKSNGYPDFSHINTSGAHYKKVR